MAPEYEGKVGEPGRDAASWEIAIPKRKPDRARGVSWQCSFQPREEIEHCQLNSCPFDVAFDGIGRG